MTDTTDMELYDAGDTDIAAAANTVEQLTRGEVDMQVATAKRWPRSIKTFKQQALGMAVKNPQIARTCYYVLPRGGKKIEGPSIRLAEIVMSCWGNLRCETRVLSADQTLITAQATAWDMQSNVLVRREVQRRITDSKGRRYNDDMIVVTGNAACSIALRNAVFSVVPRAYVEDILQHCKRVAAGERGSLDDAKAKWFKAYGDKGVERSQVLELLGKAGPDDVDIDDIATLQGLWNALSEGQTTIEELFGPEEAKDTNGVKKFGFKARQEKAAAAKAAAAEPEPEKSAIQEVTESIPYGAKPVKGEEVPPPKLHPLVQKVLEWGVPGEALEKFIKRSPLTDLNQAELKKIDRLFGELTEGSMTLEDFIKAYGTKK